jgi:4-amino-4-deoxy-L-arabinose transferase-like glycosyltransferase
MPSGGTMGRPPDPGRRSGRGRGGRAGFGLRALLLLAVCALVLLAGNGTASLLDRDEARFALAVKEMRSRGDLVLPTNWGQPRYHKPILAYWLALASERLFGESELALRLPSVLSGLAAVAATMALARRRFGERVALRAGAILGTSLLFVIESKILTADAPLLAATTASLWAWQELEPPANRRRPWQILFWLGVAAGLLAKAVNVAFLLAAGSARAFLRASRLTGGRRRTRARLAALAAGVVAAAIPPIAFLGPVLFALVALDVLASAHRRGVTRTPFGWSWGLALCAALVALWVVPAWVRSDGELLRVGLGHHLLARTSVAFEGHRGPPGTYLVTTVLAFFPWAALVPAALAGAWRDPRSELLPAWVLGTWVLVESMASKLPHYVLVALPALAVLVALEWERRIAGQVVGRGRRRIEEVLFALPCVVLAAGGAALWTIDDRAVRAAATAIGATALVVLVLVIRLGRRGAFARQFAAAFWGMLLLVLVLALGLLPALEPLRIPKRLAAEVARLVQPGEPILLVRYRPASLGCYLPAGHAIVEDQDDVARALAAGEAGLYVVPDDAPEASFERFRREHPRGWEVLGGVRGLDGLARREVRVVRRLPRTRPRARLRPMREDQRRP